MEENRGSAEVQVQISQGAVAALGLSVLSLMAMIIGGIVRCDPLSLVGFLGVLGACLLGVVSLKGVERSGGRLSGKVMATIAIVMPVVLPGCVIILPVLNSVHALAPQLSCGTNLWGLGKAMMQYANDHDDKLPCAGGKGTRWTNSTPDWTASAINQAFGLDPNGQGGRATVSSSLYLLLKYAGCPPRMFVCRSDKGTRPFRPEDYRVSKGKELTDLWDFGPEPWRHNSYSYHIPYGPYPLTTSSEAGMAVLADRNPWIASPGAKPKDFSQFRPDLDPWRGTEKQALWGNSHKHQKEQGQNVLYLDLHEEFERRSFVGIDHDNIYTRWDGNDKIRGIPPDMTTQPADRKDSLLVHDPPARSAH